MRKPKSTTLTVLLQCFTKAAFIEKHPSTDAGDLLATRRAAYASSRRSFLKNSVTTVAGMALGGGYLSSCGTVRNSRALGNKDYRIAIVGGGMAGLHCAHVLRKAGIYATIYEGSSRIGGRIFTQSNLFGEGISTEIGGEFLDSDHADMLGLARELGIETYDVYEDPAFPALIKDTFFFNGRHYSEAEVIEEFHGLVQKLEADKQGLGADYDTPLSVQLDNTSLEEYVMALNCSDWLKEMLVYAYTAEFGLDAGEQSALNFVDLIGVDTSEGFKIFGDSDERYKLRGGNSTIVEKLADTLADRIKTEYQLLRVKERSGAYTLTFGNGQEITADLVILTVPFSVLRDVELDIRGLSPEKRNCIQELGYGQNNKLILGFTDRPWREGGNNYAGYLFNDTIQNGWDSGHMQNANQGGTGYTVFLGGRESLAVADSATALGARDQVSEALLQRYLLKLEEVFPGTKDKYANRHTAALWSSNPYSRGSYACYKTGQWTTLSGYESEPVGNVYFAGEHCSEDFQGYMNGAAESGRLVAERIVARMRERV